MTDNAFLNWMVGRLINVYGENEDTDFVLRLKAIADKSIGAAEENDVDKDHKILIGCPFSEIEITAIKNKVMMFYGVDDEY